MTAIAPKMSKLGLQNGRLLFIVYTQQTKTFNRGAQDLRLGRGLDMGWTRTSKPVVRVPLVVYAKVCQVVRE